MKRALIILLIITAISLRAYTQDSIYVEVAGENRPYTEIFDGWFRNIRYDTLSTKILYDRVISFADLANRDGYNNDTLDKTDFIQAYSELNRSSNSDLKFFSMNVDNLRNNIDLSSNDSTIQLGVIYSDLSIIDTNSFNDGRLILIDSVIYVNDTNTRNIFINKNTFIATALSKTLYNNLSITFNLNNQFVYKNTNNEISKIMIDYDNGQGFIPYNINNEIMIVENISYLDYGDKIITIKVITSTNDTVTCRSKINLLYIPKSTHTITEFETFSYEPFESIYGKGEVRIYHSTSDKVLRKPILIVDGFDPGDKRKFDYDEVENKGGIWGLLKYELNGIPIHLGEELINKGYDIVILNFPTYKTYDIDGNTKYILGGADAIQRNSKVCEKVIDTLNYILKGNNSQEQLVVIGPSMGGQITRYALKTMENNILDYDYRGHNTRLWVSFDSPHQGAYIPLSIQYFLDFFGNKCGDEEAKLQYVAQIMSVAARQMLTNQMSGVSLFTRYYNEIDQLGFPDKLRKVAITDGSMNGTLTGAASRTTLEAAAGTLLVTALKMLPNGGTKGHIFYGHHPANNILKPTIIAVKPLAGQCSYDAAPGGTFNAFKVIQEALDRKWYLTTYLHESHHCFIYTKSALAYIGDKYFCEDISNRDLAPVGQTGNTPFDNYWGGNENMEHVEINHSLYNWLIKEIDTYIKGERELNLCGEYQYTISNYQQGTNVQWTCSNNLQIVSAPNSPTLIIRAIDQGNGWIRANVSSLDHRKDLGYYTITVNEGNVIAATETTGNTTWNTDLNIGNDFTVKTGHTLTIQNAKISIAPDIKIKIEPGAKLIIDNSTLTNYCGSNYWGGIEVFGIKKQLQAEQYQGTLIVKNNSIIENSRNAISTWRTNDWNSMGGIVKAENSTFRNNIRSAEFLSYKNTNSNTGEQSNVSRFTNCIFTWDRSMFPHDKTSLSHVTLWDVKDVMFIGCDFTDNQILNNSIIKHGILAEDAGLKVLAKISITPQGYNVDKSSLTKLSYGIRVSNTEKSVEVMDSYFEDNFCGVFATMVNGITIKNNEFHLIPIYNLRELYPTEPAYGIVIDYTTGYKIEQNNFFGENENLKGTGLQIKNSGQAPNEVKNNIFRKILYSTIAIGENRGLNSNGDLVGLKYKCNDFSETKRGITVLRFKNDYLYGIAPSQDGGIINQPAENIFNNGGSSDGYDIFIEDETNAYSYSYKGESNKKPLTISNNITPLGVDGETDCTRDYGLLDDLELHNHHTFLENEYLTLLYNYNSLLDGGSKDELLDKLLDSWDGDVWDLRQAYLDASPYLSPDVLKELALSEKLPLAVYLEVALSNPEGTQKDEYIDFMKSTEGENLLTPTGIELIKGSWDTKTLAQMKYLGISFIFA